MPDREKESTGLDSQYNVGNERNRIVQPPVDSRTPARRSEPVFSVTGVVFFAKMVPLFDGCAERRQSQLGQFEMLPAERNTDDGDVQQQPCEHVADGQRQTAEKNPEDIQKDGHAAAA